jgi:hypothetical protein
VEADAPAATAGKALSLLGKMRLRALSGGGHSRRCEEEVAGAAVEQAGCR